MMKTIRLTTLLLVGVCTSTAFVAPRPAVTRSATVPVLEAAELVDYNVIGLVVGQENYGLAVVALGEGIYSTLQAPSFGNAARYMIPPVISAVVLAAISGPMVTSGDPGQIATGLGIATAVSIGLGATYVLRLAAPYSPAPKEVAAVGLLVAVAGFFSFSQNLIVDGFITLPSLPTIDLPNFDLPELPAIELQLPTLDPITTDGGMPSIGQNQ